MNKENNRSAAGLRRSAIAERIRLREEWSELKGTPDVPLSSHNKQRTKPLVQKPQTRNVNRRPVGPASAKRNIINANVARSVQMSSEILIGVVALVEVGAESRALALRAALTAMGASVVPAWTPIVTHVVWAQGGCRATRAKARALASRLVSPLWVEACAAAGKRLPEQVFPAAARASDLPSPRTLRQLLKKAEMENISLVDLLSDDKDDEKERAPRLRLSSETDADTSADKSTDRSADTSRDTSHDTSKDTSRDKTDIESRVNTAPRRAMPISISPAPPTKSRRKLFTQKEVDDSKIVASGDKSDAETTIKPTRTGQARPTVRDRRDLARAERLARRLAQPRHTQPAAGDRRPRIVLTGMGKSERQAVTAAIRTLNGRLQSNVNWKTTHVLLGSCQEDDNGNLCSGISKQPHNPNISGVTTITPHPRSTSRARTAKALAGSARGCRVLRAAWAGDSAAAGHWLHHHGTSRARTAKALAGSARGCRVLRAAWAGHSAAAGHWLHHHGYEVLHLRKIAQKARIERTALGRMRSDYAYDVFNGMRVRVSPQTDQRDAAIELLKLCGAVTLDSATGQYGGATQDGGCRQDGDCDMTIGAAEGQVNSKWVFDSVAAGRMRTARRYINNALSSTIITGR